MSLSGPARARTWTRSNNSWETWKQLYSDAPYPTWQALDRICREEWEKLPKYRCAKLVESYPRRLEAVIAAKGASTKYWVKGLNTCVNVISDIILNTLANMSKNLFLLCHYGVLWCHYGVLWCHYGVLRCHYGVLWCHYGVLSCHYGVLCADWWGIKKCILE
jgi:hypothetical protein